MTVSIAMLLFCLVALCCERCYGHLDPPPAVSRVRHLKISRRIEPGISLTVSRSTLQGDKPAYVRVSWGQLPATMLDSWIGMYLAHDDVNNVVPLKYNFCNRSTGRNLSEVSGSLSFRVLNYRDSVIFRLFHGWEHPVLISESKEIVVREPFFPTGVRLALTGNAGEVSITWTSTHGQADVTHVLYRVFNADGDLKEHGIANVTSIESYTRNELCGAPAAQEGFRDPGAFYTAKIKDLQSGSFVKYKVVVAHAVSETFAFRAPLAPGSPVKIFAFGDLGEHPRDDSAQAQGEPWFSQEFAYGDPGVHNTTLAMHMDHSDNPANLVLHNGDLSYAMGYSSMWEVFHDNIEPLSAQLPWMVTIGNHERDWPGTNSTRFGDTDSMGECGVPTMRRFAAQPFASRRLPPQDEPWYILKVGVVIIIAISTEHDLSVGSRQHAWLEKTLKDIADDRAASYPWLIVAGHRPYVVDSSWPGDEDFAAYYQAAIGELIGAHRVDLILGGHHHSYQRSCALNKGSCAETGTTVLNVGMAGASFNQVNKTMPPVFRYADDTHYGYCRIVADADVLKAEFVHSADGKVYDSVTLSKQHVLNI